MVKASDVFASTRDLVDDLEQDYATDAYLQGKANLAQKELVLRLSQHASITRYKTAVVLANVAAGTTSLKEKFAAGKPLELLSEIISLREKPAGSDDANYQEMGEREVPPSSLAPNDYNMFYTFTGDDILLPGASQALDMRFYGAFDPKPITSPDSAILPGSDVVMIYLTAAITARSHGNKELAKDLHGKYEELLDALMNNIIMESQMQPSRPRGNSTAADSVGSR